MNSIRWWSLALCAVAFPSTANATVLLSEGFNNITTLTGSGWVLINNSSPVGTIGWFQGNPGVFPSQAGAADSYIASNFNAAGFPGDISNWLLTPTVMLDDGQTFSFFTRTEDLPVAADALEIRLSTNGASTNVGGTATSVGDFTTLLLSINPTLALNGYPQGWTQFSVTLSGLGGPISGRIAFRYAVPDTTTNADYIGIDSVTLADTIPEPTTLALSLAGLLFIFHGARRLKNRGVK